MTDPTIDPTTPDHAPPAEPTTEPWLPPPPDRAAPSEVRFGLRIGRGDGRKLAGIVGAAAVFVASAAIVAAASPAASPGASTAPGSSASPDGGAGKGPGRGLGPSFRGGMPFVGGPFGGGTAPGLRGGPAIGLRVITISGIDGSKVTLHTEDGWTRTITITSSTRLTKGGQAIALGDLHVGDQVRFSQTRATDGSYTIDALEVVVPQVAGRVSAVSGSGFTIAAGDGTTWTVTVTGATAYSLGGLDGQHAASKADVAVGDQVDVAGTQGSGNTITALSVRIQLPTVVGTLSARSGSTLTVTRRDGTTLTVHVGSGTTYRVPGKTSAGLADLEVGQGIVVQGRQRSDGSIDASAILGGGAFAGHGPMGKGPLAPDASAAPSGSSS